MLKRIEAAAVVDAAGTRAQPGVILLDGDRIIGAGSPAEVGESPRARRVDARDRVALPALVNVHTHLDLTRVGPQPFPGSYRRWVDMVRQTRPLTAWAVRRAVRRGVLLSRAGGTALVGDIAGIQSQVPVRALRRSGLGGVSYVELFGTGVHIETGISRLKRVVSRWPRDRDGVVLGLQPHAPYSCGLRLYQAAVESGLPVSTHLAETREELQLLEQGDGPLADMLRGHGLEGPGRPGQHPVDWLADILPRRPWVLAHVNYVDRAHMARLKDWPVTVAYCPRASTYFGHAQAGQPGHRYREMLDAGINVALGTDSLICLDTPDRISVLDEIRFLHRRDGTDAGRLLHMATRAGARALRFPEGLVTVRPGPTAGILGLPMNGHRDPLAALAAGDGTPVWLHGPVPGPHLER